MYAESVYNGSIGRIYYERAAVAALFYDYEYLLLCMRFLCFLHAFGLCGVACEFYYPMILHYSQTSNSKFYRGLSRE